MGAFNREFIQKLKEAGFVPEVVDKAKHQQVFVDGQLIATLRSGGNPTNRRHELAARATLNRLKRLNPPKGNPDAQR